MNAKEFAYLSLKWQWCFEHSDPSECEDDLDILTDTFAKSEIIIMVL